MNILHISRTMGQGGAEKVVLQLCSADYDNAKIVVASIGGTLEEKLKEKSVEHVYIPDLDNKNPVNILKTFIILNKIIKEYKIDVIHSHHRMAAFYSRILNFLNPKVKRVYTAHNVFFNKRKLLKFSLKKSKIIAVGQGVKNNLIDYFGIEQGRIDIIYNSVEKPKIISEVNDDIFNVKNGIYIGNIGRLSEQKGIDVYINAMSSIIKNNKNIYGIIIGDGELKNDLIELVRKNNISDNIIFLGYRSDVLNLIRKLDFVVLSSRWEGFPLTPIETFMMGKTIIASNIDGNNEIVKHEYNGLLFEKDNVSELSNKIERLINDKRLLNTFEKNALNDYKEKYSYDTFINQYVKLYKKCLIK